jgi:phosphotransferase system enzyme I (PtsI)
MRTYQRRFHDMKDPLIRERVRDVQDIERRLMRHLLGQAREDLSHLTEPVVVIARDLTPSQAAHLDTTKVVGVATDAGGLTSHTAIFARSLEIPAVMGLEDATTCVSGGDLVIVDGTHGLVIGNPDVETEDRYRAMESKHHEMRVGLQELRDLPAETIDGVRVYLNGNIEFPHEVATCLAKGADGVGLYRTEFLYLREDDEPTEEDHLAAYLEAIRASEGKPMVIRTLDLGADKYTQNRSFEPERNPFLGLRSIRYCLQHLDVFKIQLRAILRASVEGDIRIMFPLITGLMEFRQGRMVLGEAMEDLEEQGIPFRREIPLGIMIETPAAALQCKEFAREVEFVSIGTNDLIQYTLAVDRSNERVASLYTASHPAVVLLLRDIIRTSEKYDVECSLCGEIAGEPIYTLLLLGLGLRRFSMAAGDVPEIKKIIRSTTTAHAQKVARRALGFETDRQVTNYLRDETRKIWPYAV